MSGNDEQPDTNAGSAGTAEVAGSAGRDTDSGGVAATGTDPDTDTLSATDAGRETPADRRLTCAVEGMHCAGCVANVEKALRGVPGVV